MLYFSFICLLLGLRGLRELSLSKSPNCLIGEIYGDDFSKYLLCSWGGRVSRGMSFSKEFLWSIPKKEPSFSLLICFWHEFRWNGVLDDESYFWVCLSGLKFLLWGILWFWDKSWFLSWLGLSSMFMFLWVDEGESSLKWKWG